MSNRTIESIYTDGACIGNPGPGGWGVVIYFSDRSIYEFGGFEAISTNNRMEMQAAIAALDYLAAAKQTQPVTLYTDSEYLVKGVTQWVKGWKKKGWKTAQGKPVLNQELWETLDKLNTSIIKWQHIRGHAGNVGNERCDAIANAFAHGKSSSLSLKQSSLIPADDFPVQNNHSPVTKLADLTSNIMIMDQKTQQSCLTSDTTMLDSSASTQATGEELPRESRVAQLRNLIEMLRIADEIADTGYWITSAELADLMQVHTSAVTARGDVWRWRNWIVTRVGREGNQILWELERAEQVNIEAEEKIIS